jgi:hypothetical protein
MWMDNGHIFYHIRVYNVEGILIGYPNFERIYIRIREIYPQQQKLPIELKFALHLQRLSMLYLELMCNF